MPYASEPAYPKLGLMANLDLARMWTPQSHARASRHTYGGVARTLDRCRQMPPAHNRFGTLRCETQNRHHQLNPSFNAVHLRSVPASQRRFVAIVLHSGPCCWEFVSSSVTRLKCRSGHAERWSSAKHSPERHTVGPAPEKAKQRDWLQPWTLLLEVTEACGSV
ncbi:hypothetical protein SKAU_G00405690 [Synaphobranchus kaupii]|uniref:Uncharacterized protein n=1 Tax=Synaphobranchus kaupii TaxID=118154 RepID=A0A9Q1E9V9_SYNKA|nr:hypothetical protein SKAU_G00405690 [Synaphobranchus kaupii]